MIESKVISAFLSSRKDYELVRNHLDTEDWSPMGDAVLELVDDYYDRDDSAEHVDPELLSSAIKRRFSDIPRHLEQARTFLEEVQADATSNVNVVHEVLEAARAKIRLKLADALLRQDEVMTPELLSQYGVLMEQVTLANDVEEEFQGLDISEIANRFDEHGSWHLAPRELDVRIKGGVRYGHHIVIGARPERGKTLFGIALTACFARQGAKVLYTCNEDPVEDIILRFMSCLTGLTEDKLFEDPDEAMRLAREAGYDNVVFASLSPGTPRDVEALCRRHKPDVVIVDQMRNLRMKSENNTQRLEQVAQELRNVARRCQCVMVSFTQVGDSGRDELYLDDGDIDGSNTGIPGACDVILLIGSNDDYELRELRMLNLAKNKRGGNHDSFAVRVDRKLSRVYSYSLETG